MKPLVGICVNISLPDDNKRTFSKGTALHLIQEDYIKFVEISGGTPILLPMVNDSDDINGMVSAIDAVILTGGVDVDPALYGQENSHSLGVYRKRDDFEIGIVAAARQKGIPILGVCRGMQILNVALGGSLIQDIPTEISNSLKHTRVPDDPETIHPASMTRPSFLSEIYDPENFTVNSSHHQSVDKVGGDVEIIAEAPDGVIEAFRSVTDRCTIGIQWHPERLRHEPSHLGLGRWFVEQASVQTKG